MFHADWWKDTMMVTNRPLGLGFGSQSGGGGPSVLSVRRESQAISGGLRDGLRGGLRVGGRMAAQVAHLLLAALVREALRRDCPAPPA